MEGREDQIAETLERASRKGKREAAEEAQGTEELAEMPEIRMSKC